MSSPLDDHIRALLDRTRVTMIGQLEADLAASTADILRAVADEHRQALLHADERAAADKRLAEEHLSVLRTQIEREREELQSSASSEIAALERVLAQVREEVDAMRRSLEDAQLAQDALRRQLEEAVQGADVSRLELQSLRTSLARATRLASAFRTLDQATSLGDILDSLVRSARQESDRSAVFLVNGSKLRGWRALGFDTPDPIVGADFNPDESGVVGRAARSGISYQHRNGDAALVPAFAAAHAPRDAVALPVQVGGSVIAVLYADAPRADRPDEPEWLDAIDAMTKHAGRALEAMTVRQAAALWMPRRRTGDSSSVSGGGSAI